jgi:hypothetical protein
MKPGDKVRCTNNSCLEEWCVHDRLTVSKVYEVTSATLDTIDVVDDSGTDNSYYNHRFELVDEGKPKLYNLGDEVVCVDASGPEEIGLTYHKVYKVTDSLGIEEGTQVENDLGNKVWFSNGRFLLRSEYDSAQKWMKDLDDPEPGKDNVTRKGDTVVLSRQCVEWYKNHLVFLYSIGTEVEGEREFRDKSVNDILFWLLHYKKNISPVGKVYGFASYEENSLRAGAFGSRCLGSA